MKTIFRVSVMLLFMGAGFSCVQTHGAVADEYTGPVKTRLNFHLVDGESMSLLDEYLEAHPGAEPVCNTDGTFTFPELPFPAATLVLGAYRSSGEGEDEFVRYFVVYKEPALRGLAVKEASALLNEMTSKPEIVFTIDSYQEKNGMIRHGREILMRITEQNRGKIMTIVFNNRIIAAARIHETIANGQVRLSGSFTWAEARRLAEALTADATGSPDAD